MHDHDHQSEKPNKYFVLVILILSVAGIIYTFSRPTKEEFISGKVKEIISEREVVQDFNNKKIIEQELNVEIAANKNAKVLNDYGPVETGDTVFVNGSLFGEGEFNVVEISKTKGVFFLLIFFVVLTILTGGWKGFNALVGLSFSLAVILIFIVPQILGGASPVLIGLLGSTLILIPTLYLSYGFSKKSISAFIGIITSLFFVGILASFSISVMNFTGLTEESIFLNMEANTSINLVGLLIAGIIIAAVGVLDDVAVTQASTVFSLVSANPSLQGLTLFKKAMNVGRDHISAVINTLVLAYTGAALPLVLLLSYRGVSVNYFTSMEIVAEEIVRTLISSSGLLLAVPLTTLVAVLFTKYKAIKS